MSLKRLNQIKATFQEMLSIVDGVVFEEWDNQGRMGVVAHFIRLEHKFSLELVFGLNLNESLLFTHFVEEMMDQMTDSCIVFNGLIEEETIQAIKIQLEKILGADEEFFKRWSKLLKMQIENSQKYLQLVKKVAEKTALEIEQGDFPMVKIHVSDLTKELVELIEKSFQDKKQKEEETVWPRL